MKTTTCPGQSNALRPHDCGGCKSGFGCYYAPAEVAATVADERARNSLVTAGSRNPTRCRHRHLANWRGTAKTFARTWAAFASSMGESK